MKTNWEQKTGMTRKQVEVLFIETINELISLGASESIAREIATEALKETMGLN